MKQHPRLTTTIFSLAFGICFLFTMAACAPQQNADGELAFYANARSEGDSKFLDSGVLSLERGFYDETNANHVLCLNATAQPNEYCEWVTYESTNNNIQIGSTPGAWGDSVTITAEKAAEGFFLYCNVITDSLSLDSACAFQEFANSELAITFEGSNSSTSYYYRIAPTDAYIAALNHEEGPEESKDAYHGPRFIVQKRTV